MDPAVRENWRKIRDALEAAGKTDNWYYKRAVAILAGRPDPLGEGPTIPPG
jgi:hypothetical protein